MEKYIVKSSKLSTKKAKIILESLDTNNSTAVVQDTKSVDMKIPHLMELHNLDLDIHI